MKEQCKRQWKHWVKFFCKAMVMVGLPVCMAALALGAYLQTTTGVLVATDKPCQFVNPQAVAAAFISGTDRSGSILGEQPISKGPPAMCGGRESVGISTMLAPDVHGLHCIPLSVTTLNQYGPVPADPRPP